MSPCMRKAQSALFAGSGFTYHVIGQRVVANGWGFIQKQAVRFRVKGLGCCCTHGHVTCTSLCKMVLVAAHARRGIPDISGNLAQKPTISHLWPVESV